MCEHNKVEVSTGALAEFLDAPTVPVDERLAPLMRELWARDIWAEDYSCEQRWPGLACLYFGFTSALEDFLWVAEKRDRFAGYKVEVETFEICVGCAAGADPEEDDAEGGAAEGHNDPRTCVDLYVVIPTRDLPGLARLFAAEPLPQPRPPKPLRRWRPGNN
jgi:hypothetical protein